MTQPVVRTREELDAALRVIEGLEVGRRLDRLERQVEKLRQRTRQQSTPVKDRLTTLEERVAELEEDIEVPQSGPAGTIRTAAQATAANTKEKAT